MDDLAQNLIPSLRKYLLPLSLGFLGMILLGYGLIGSFSSKRSESDIVFTAGDESEEAVKSAAVKKEITIDVAGAVNNPGVYQLPEGSRVQDAFKIAGGMSDEADRLFVEKSFNLAALLRDGAKIYIPRVGEGIGSTATNGSSEQIQDNFGTMNVGMININTATLGELDTLSGVGPVTAGKIIDNRPYVSIEELLERKIVSKSVYEKIKAKISVY